MSKKIERYILEGEVSVERIEKLINKLPKTIKKEAFNADTDFKHIVVPEDLTIKFKEGFVHAGYQDRGCRWGMSYEVCNRDLRKTIELLIERLKDR